MRASQSRFARAKENARDGRSYITRIVVPREKVRVMPQELVGRATVICQPAVSLHLTASAFAASGALSRAAKASRRRIRVRGRRIIGAPVGPGPTRIMH